MSENLTEDIKKYEKEIQNMNDISKEAKNKRDKNVYRNLLSANIVMLYLVAINLGFFCLEKTIFIKCTAVCSMLTLIITIIFYETAYKTEKDFYILHGIETLVISIFTFFIPHTYYNYGIIARKILMVTPVFFGIYYCLKAIGICIKANKNKNNDIKDIIKNENKVDDEKWINMDKDKEAEMSDDEEENKANTEQNKRIILESEKTENKTKIRKGKESIKKNANTKLEKKSHTKGEKDKTENKKTKATSKTKSIVKKKSETSKSTARVKKVTKEKDNTSKTKKDAKEKPKENSKKAKNEKDETKKVKKKSDKKEE